MLNRNHLFTLLVLALAVAAVALKAPLASSQGLTITAARISDALPLDAPQSELWRQATAVQVPLSAQNIARPIIPATSVKSVTASALYNDQEIALLLEWADDTRNDSTLAVDQFRDGVAVQFPIAEGVPFFCMGQEGGDVVIWHWKADWQAQILAQQSLDEVYPNMYVDYYPFTAEGDDPLTAPYTEVEFLPALAAGNLLASLQRPSPVENLVAGGFGSLTSLPLERQTVAGHGEWGDGVWRVILSRSLAAAAADDISLAADKVYSIAFAAWDGANGERNGAKSTSQWVSLQLGAAAAEPAPAAPAPAAPRPAAAQPITVPSGPPTWVWVILAAVGFFTLVGVIVFLGLED